MIPGKSVSWWTVLVAIGVTSPLTARAQSVAESTAVFVALGVALSELPVTSVKPFFRCDTLAGPCRRDESGRTVSIVRGENMVDAFAAAAAIVVEDGPSHVCPRGDDEIGVGQTVLLGPPRFEVDSVTIKVVLSCRYRRRSSWMTGSSYYEYGLRRLAGYWQVVGRRLTLMVNE